MLDVTQTLEEEAARFVRDLCRHHSPDERSGSNTVSFDDQGHAHVRGGMFNATGGRDYHLSIMGLSREDVTSFRRIIKAKLGFEPPCSMAEALLAQTRERGTMSPTMPVDIEKRRARERRKKARRREKARAAGLCIICCKNAASYSPKDGTQNATCLECQQKANAAKKVAK